MRERLGRVKARLAMSCFFSSVLAGPEAGLYYCLSSSEAFSAGSERAMNSMGFTQKCSRQHSPTRICAWKGSLPERID